MKYMIFEDNELSELSIRIKNGYCNENVGIIFAGSNAGIKTVLKKCIDSDDEFIIYLDMPADNTKVYGVLTSIQKMIVKYKLKALIVPIPGIEYAVCKTYALDVSAWVNNDVELQRKVAKYLGKGRVSFESYLKYLVGKFCDIKSVNVKRLITNLPMFYDNGSINVSLSNVDLEYYNSLYKHLIELLNIYKEKEMISENEEKFALTQLNEFTKLFNERWR